MSSFAEADRLRRFSNTMVVVTTIGMVAIAVGMSLVFVVPEWTRTCYWRGWARRAAISR